MSDITITCAPMPDGGATIIAVSMDTPPFTSSVISDPSSGSVTIPSVPNGLLSITVTKIGYYPILSSLQVTRTMAVTLQMVQNIDPTGEQAAKPNIPTQAITPSVIGWDAPTVDPEWLPPNSNDGVYITGNNARIYIGNLFIDEVDLFNFYMQDNKLPVYGYRSRFFDALAQGRSLVQGGFRINFVHEGYMYTALQEYKNTMNVIADDEAYAALAALDRSCETMQLQVKQGLASKSDLAILMKQRDAMIGTYPDSTIIDRLKKTRLSSTDVNSHDEYIFNAVYEDIMFDLVIEVIRGGRTVTRRLEKCVLTGNTQTYDNSGNPVSDDYSFIARRLR